MLSGRRILILGPSGQVGSALAHLLAKQNPLLLDQDQADFTQPEVLIKEIKKRDPEIILNAAAYTAVDQAEKEKALAKKINAETPGQVAKWCADHQRIFVHYSTDYVFPGTGEVPWKESDPPQPLNYYGQSKLWGEQEVLKSQGQAYVFRTSWVYDEKGKNFLRTMLRLRKEKPSLRVVSDQFGAPTYARDLAHATLQVLENALTGGKSKAGLYHLCNRGVTTWYHFACRIFELAGKKDPTLKIPEVIPISTDQYPTPALRPKNSRLDTRLVSEAFGVVLPDWDEGLRRCMEQVHETH